MRKISVGTIPLGKKGELGRWFITFDRLPPEKTMQEWNKGLYEAIGERYLFFSSPADKRIADKILAKIRQTHALLRGYCEAARWEKEDAADRLFGQLEAWYRRIEQRKLEIAYHRWSVENGRILVVRDLYDITSDDNVSVCDMTIDAIVEDTFEYILRKVYELDAVLWLLGEIEEVQGDMVTIKRLAIESGENENTVRGRINKARKLGKLKKWEKQGGTVLVDRTEGLKIANSVGQPMVKMGRPRKSH